MCCHKELVEGEIKTVRLKIDPVLQPVSRVVSQKELILMQRWASLSELCQEKIADDLDQMKEKGRRQAKESPKVWIKLISRVRQKTSTNIIIVKKVRQKWLRQPKSKHPRKRSQLWKQMTIARAATTKSTCTGWPRSQVTIRKTRWCRCPFLRDSTRYLQVVNNLSANFWTTRLWRKIRRRASKFQKRLPMVNRSAPNKEWGTLWSTLWVWELNPSMLIQPMGEAWLVDQITTTFTVALQVIKGRLTQILWPKIRQICASHARNTPKIVCLWEISRPKVEIHREIYLKQEMCQLITNKPPPKIIF